MSPPWKNDQEVEFSLENVKVDDIIAMDNHILKSFNEHKLYTHNSLKAICEELVIITWFLTLTTSSPLAARTDRKITWREYQTENLTGQFISSKSTSDHIWKAWGKL